MAEKSSSMGKQIEFQGKKSSFELFGKIEFPVSFKTHKKKAWQQMRVQLPLPGRRNSWRLALVVCRMPVFEAVVLVTPLTNDFDELCLLALLHRTSVLGFALGFFPTVPVEVGGDTGVRRSTLGSGNRSVTQGTHRNL